MAALTPQFLLKRHAVLKTAWQKRLRARPPVSALARVEILAHYMDASLKKLGDLLPVRPEELAPSGLAAWPDNWRVGCPCGINPLLDYYATGEEALIAEFEELTDEEGNRLRQCWRKLAGEELHNLCAICCHRPGGSPVASPVRA